MMYRLRGPLNHLATRLCLAHSVNVGHTLFVLACTPLAAPRCAHVVLPYKGLFHSFLLLTFQPRPPSSMADSNALVVSTQADLQPPGSEQLCADILRLIFEHLDTSVPGDRAACASGARVCTSWFRPASQALWRTLPEHLGLFPLYRLLTSKIGLEGPVLGPEVDRSRTEDRTDEDRSTSPVPTSPVLVPVPVLSHSVGKRTGPGPVRTSPGPCQKTGKD